MASRVFWRRSATAAWVYAAVVFGILGTVVAARVLGLREFGIYVTALAAVGFFQVLLDLTVEEPLTKFGFRYVVSEEWGKLRRLFVKALQVKFAGGVLAALALALLAPVADTIFGAEGLTVPILVGALMPLVQATENVGATALLLRGRYDLRGAYQTFAMVLRLTAIAIAAPYGVTETLAAMVVAQAIATAAVSVVGLLAFRRFPAAPSRALGEDRREVISFTLASSVGTGVVSLRTTLVPLMLAIVAGPTQVGLFRIAQTPQTGLSAASSPARLILLTDQTRAWERGRQRSVLAGLRLYTLVAVGLMVVAVPVLLLTMPWLVRTIFGSEYSGSVDAARVVLVAGAIQFALGWSKSLPVTIGRPRLRIVTHGLEALVVIPLVALLGAEWGATGAAVAVLVATFVYALAWGVAIARLRVDVAEHELGESAVTP
ncbi:MAG: lipopolysaccharide biosynthesis protein [Actinomycetota bacterium]|nr:lipopolysaccharide biosynthesis protein [Actinomycetota bacterium]